MRYLFLKFFLKLKLELVLKIRLWCPFLKKKIDIDSPFLVSVFMKFSLNIEIEP